MRTFFSVTLDQDFLLVQGWLYSPTNRPIIAFIAFLDMKLLIWKYFYIEIGMSNALRDENAKVRLFRPRNNTWEKKKNRSTKKKKSENE